MTLIGTIIKPIDTFDMKVFHIRLAKGRLRFLRETIVARHIGERPWSEMTWMDKEGYVHEVFAK